MSPRGVARSACVIVLCVFIASQVAAQVNTADIVGTVTDPTGAVVVGARITVTNLATQAVRTTETDSTGNYLVPLLPAGRYSVRAEMRGFKAAVTPEVALAAGDRLRLDIAMQVGEVAETIEVAAQTPALQSDTSSIGSLVHERAVQDLPLNQRNFIRLAQLAVGAHESVPNALSSGNRPDDRRRTSAVAVNGQRDFVNNFMIDGMDNNERSIGTVIVKPSMDAVAEFRVQTNLYSAELGRTAGGVINLVTKSGTNEIHGSLFEFFRNEKLDAKNFFAGPGPTPSYKQNQFGGSLGGPIRRNRTFYFGDYEGFRVRQGVTLVSTVPTAEMRRGDFAGINAIFDPLTTRTDPARPGVSIRDRFPGDRIPAARLNPIAVRLAALYPEPQRPGLVNNYTLNPVRTQRDDTFDARIDHHFCERDAFFGRYSFNDTNTWLPPPLPKVGDVHPGGSAGGFAGSTLQRSQGLALNHVRTFRPNLVAELKAGYTRFALATLPPNYGKNVSEQMGIRGSNVDLSSSGLSLIAIAGFRGLGDSDWIPMFIINNTFQYVGSLAWTRSGHNVKTGVDVRRRQFTVHQGAFPRGNFSFNANFTNDPSGATPASGNSFASFLLGFPASTARRTHEVWPGMRTTEVGAYVQNDWRATSWLTFNLGVRWDLFTPLTEVADRISNVDLAAGKIIIAGRDGVSRSAGVVTDWNDIAPRFGFAATLPGRTVLRGGYGLNLYATNYASPAHFRNPPFTSIFGIDTTPLTPINSLSDGFPHPVPGDPRNPAGPLAAVDLNLRSAYVQQYNLTLQREMLSGLVWSVGYVGALGRKQVGEPNVNLALPGPGAIAPRRQYAARFPNATSISLLHGFGVSNYHALQSTLEHRFKSGLNLSSNYTYARNISDTTAVAGGKPGAGPFPQLVNNYRLERGNSDIDVRHRWVLMTNYELPFGKRLAGLAGALSKGWQLNAIAVLQSGLTFTVFNASPRANTGGGDRPNRIGAGILPKAQRSVHRWFDTTAFVAQPLFEIGNAGRNILYGPGQKTLDFSVFKHFELTERTRLQFRAEAFNLTNTPNFGVPESALGAAPFGTINNTGNALPRNIQLALKVLF